MTNLAAVEVDELLIESAQRLFADTCSFDDVQGAEEAGWAPAVWQAVADAGFAWIGLAESAGGSGGSLADACEVIRIAGSFAAPIPLAETAMLGGWLLAEAGIELPFGAVTVVPGTTDDTLVATPGEDGSLMLSGTVHRVPWASAADRIALLVPIDDVCLVAAISSAQVRIDKATNMAGEPRESITFDALSISGAQLATIADPAIAQRLRLRGALSRTMLMAGAMEAMSRLTVDYSEQRHQFGRPIGRFQAVQQHLVWGAQDAAITKMAAQLAARHAAVDLDGARFQIAAARTIADGCAATATRWAHQAHGAIGMTQEYGLHHLSRRLWAWRHEFARPGEWLGVVGDVAQEVGADGLYPLIAS